MRCIDSYACRLFYSIYMQLKENLIRGFSRRQNKPLMKVFRRALCSTKRSLLLLLCESILCNIVGNPSQAR